MSITAAFYSAYFARMDKLGSAQLDQVLKRKPRNVIQQSNDQIARSVMDWLRTSEKATNGHR